MGSIDLFKACRQAQAYSSKAGFDEHSTTRHSVADPFHDQIKRDAWFCLKHGLLNPKVNEGSPHLNALDGDGKPTGKVPKQLLDVTSKGISKISQNFSFKLYDSFPDIRYEVLCESQ